MIFITSAARAVEARYQVEIVDRGPDSWRLWNQGLNMSKGLPPSLKRTMGINVGKYALGWFETLRAEQRLEEELNARLKALKADRRALLERFDANRDGGKGVVITSGSGFPFSAMKGDYGYGIPLRELIDG